MRRPCGLLGPTKQDTSRPNPLANVLVSGVKFRANTTAFPLAWPLSQCASICKSNRLERVFKVRAVKPKWTGATCLSSTACNAYLERFGRPVSGQVGQHPPHLGYRRRTDPLWRYIT